MTQSVIVSAKRSPVGKYLGGLSALSATEVGTQVAKAVLAETNPTVDEVFVGCVLQAGLGQNPARQVALGAGLPDTMTACTVNKVCGSGLESVMLGDRTIRAGDAEVILAGGIESMSQAPYLVKGARTGLKFGDGKFVDEMQFDGLTCVFEKWAMGFAADYIANKCNVTRQQQDEFAYNSHRKAAEATKAGKFDTERVPIETRKGPFNTDETIRFDASVESLAKLKPVFNKDGTVTAGNASALSDGAGMVLIASENAAKKNNWPVRAKIIAHATAGVAPKKLFIAPVDATRKVAEKAGRKLSDIDLFELNEAFASQSVACLNALELDPGKVNIYGGAIALGHPIGASGARVLVTLLHAMEQENAKTGIACLCLGGGNAVAMLIERP